MVNYYVTGILLRSSDVVVILNLNENKFDWNL